VNDETAETPLPDEKRLCGLSLSLRSLRRDHLAHPTHAVF